VITAAPALGTQTIPSLWRYVLDRRLATPAYLEEQADGWREVSWAEAGGRVDALAKALLGRGVKQGDAVVVLARTRLEWLLLDWAIMSIGAVVVGLYPTNTAAECEYIVSHAEAVLAFVENDEQYEKLASVFTGPIVKFAEIPTLEAEGRSSDTPSAGRWYRRCR
jgi:long-chain acyl-CoA synthetase